MLFSILLFITVSYLNNTVPVIDNEISTWSALGFIGYFGKKPMINCQSYDLLA
jgi:hypothetical protein